ncbi:MAG: helix-turn-helix transcriptional regulator [Eubacterium sp.]|nr:helix-turn-helix transcriptional regulator [Eubacterium sp.]
MTISEARKIVGLTQQAITDKFGIPRRTLQDWEAGRRSCPKWCEHLIVDKILSYNTYKQVLVMDPERIDGEFHYDGQKIFSYKNIDDDKIELDNGVIISIDSNSEGSYYDENHKQYFELIEKQLKINGDVINQKVIGFVDYYND